MMRYIAVIIITCFLDSNLVEIQQDINEQGSITIRITNLKSQVGQVGISLYNTEDGFPRKESAIFRQIYLSYWKGTVADTVLTGLPVGDYAIAAFNDTSGSKMGGGKIYIFGGHSNSGNRDEILIASPLYPSGMHSGMPSLTALAQFRDGIPIIL